MDVSGVGSAYGAYPIRPVSPNPSSVAAGAVRPESPQDELQISSVGKMLDKISQNSNVRAERLALIKEAIDNGTYDTDAKMEAALEKMLSSFGPGYNESSRD